MNTQSSLAVELKEKEYRDAYVASRLRMSLPKQCRALRENREMTQPQLAEAAGMSQPRISEIERPGERRLNLETLLRLASAFDVALQVRFVAFSDFVDDNDTVDLDSYDVPDFERDMNVLAEIEEKSKSVVPIEGWLAKQLIGEGQGTRLGAGQSASIGMTEPKAMPIVVRNHNTMKVTVEENAA